MDPAAGQPGERNLDGARQMIEILSILQSKTKGNLDPDEAAMLENVLYELRLRFVDAQREGSASRIITP